MYMASSITTEDVTGIGTPQLCWFLTIRRDFINIISILYAVWDNPPKRITRKVVILEKKV